MPVTPTPALPDRARVVVIGGGVIGCSVAYHLAHEGWTDVVVLERDRLTSGTTWHAAGLMTCFGSTSETSTAIRLYSRDLYARLEAETGVATGFKPVGLIEAAADADRLHEYRRVAAFQRHLGLEVEEIGPREMSDLFPWARTDDLLAGFHVAGDGRVNPVDLTQSLARGAKNLGVRVVEGVRVDDVLTKDGAVTGVVVSTGSTDDPSSTGSTGGGTTTVECEYVVNCTGMWARELGEKNGVVIPNQAAEHYYLITDTIEGIDPNAPIFEDPASYGYYREEGGGMMVGLFEPHAAAWSVDGIPRSASFTTLKPDWDRMSPFLEKAMARVPVTLEVGVRTFFCGPESFTPDLAPAVGEAPGIRNYFVAAGMNSVGVLSAGGLGRVLAHWIISGLPDVDVTAWDVARFRADQLEPSYRRERTTEILGTVYAAHTPGKQLHTMRDRLLSPVHERLVSNGGLLREVSGWEGADWFAGPGRTAEAEPTWGRAPWFEQWASEHQTVREGVGLMDMSFMATFAVLGAEAGPVLDRLSAGDVNGEPGWLTYTQWLNDDGRIEADLTVGKLGRGADVRDRLGHRPRPRPRHARPRGARPRREGPRRDRRRRPAQPAGAVVPRGPGDPHRRRPLDGGLAVPRRPRDLGGGSAGRSAPGSPISASSATSSTPTPTAPSSCTTRWPRHPAYARSGSRRWRRCGWRRPTATTATTSTTPTALSTWVSASRSRGTPTSVARPRCWPARSRSRRPSGWCRSGSATPSRCSTTPSRCSATARWSATSAPRRTAGRSAPPSGWPSSAPPSR